MAEPINPLAQELAFFDAHLKEWLPIHEGKFVLIKNGHLLGTFDSAETAYREGLAKLGNVPMLVRQVVSRQPIESAPALMHWVLRGDT